MNRRLAAFSVLAALALGFVLVRMGTAEAKGDYVAELTAAYPNTAGTKLADCSTCHTSVPSLNAFGADLAAAGRNFAAVASMDSDGDGVSNDAELRALTFPGDASDFPTTTTTTVATTVPPTTPTTTPTSVPDTTVPSTIIPAPTAAPAPTGDVVFPMVIDAGEAGTVTIDLVDGKLIAQVEAADGWTFTVETEDGHEVEVKLRNGESEVEVEAEYEDGNLEVKIETESDDASDDDDSDDDESRRGGQDDDSDDDDDHDGDDDHDDDDDHHGDDHDDDDDDDDDD